MRSRRQQSITGLSVAVALLLCGASAAAGSAGPVDRAFPGGRISQLAVNDGPTAGSFADVSYEYARCGAEVGEIACSWRIDVGLAPEGFELCPSSLDAGPLVWSSGEQSANGAVASGPRAFALRGTPGQVLCIVLSQTSTRESGGSTFTSGGSTVLDAVLMGPELISPVEATERRIIAANPPALVEPPPESPALVVSPDCKALAIGDASYAFVHRQLGCRKARNLAAMAHVSRTAPPGYWCKRRASGGKRCWRQGHPKKYLEWHVPDGRPAPNPS